MSWSACSSAGQAHGPGYVSLDYLALAEATAARPGWQAVATPHRTRPECSRAMVGGRRAVGSCRTERRDGARRHEGGLLLKVRTPTSPGEARAALRQARTSSQRTLAAGVARGSPREEVGSARPRLHRAQHGVSETGDTLCRPQRLGHLIHLITTGWTEEVAAIMSVSKDRKM